MSYNELTEKEIEAEIQEKGLTAPRITPDYIDSLIVDQSFTILPSGKTGITELVLKNGFSVRGETSVVSKENFDVELGKKISFDKARDKIWELEGYLLQEKIYWQQCAIQTLSTNNNSLEE